MLVMVTEAPGIAAPEESSTLPDTVAVTWAQTVQDAKQIARRTYAKARARTLLPESMLHPSNFFRTWFWGIILPASFAKASNNRSHKLNDKPIGARYRRRE